MPLVDPFETYHGNKLYLDGLAFMGCIHLPKLLKPYEIVHPKSVEEQPGDYLRKMLALVSGFKFEE